MKKIFSIAAFLFLCAAPALAQEADTLGPSQKVFTLDADFLSRGEVRQGGLTRVDENSVASFIIERTIIGASYSNSSLSSRVSAQHSGTWGSNEAGSLSIFEAWVQFKSKSGLFAKVGRQPLIYDDQRIFGSDSWSMTAMSHDLLKLGWEGRGHKLHLFGAYNQDIQNINGGSFFSGGLQPYKSMAALWYHWDVPSFPLGASFVLMDAGMQGGEDESNDRVFHQQLAGTYISFTPKRWSAEAAFYYQMGKEETGLPLSAWMASIKTTLKMPQKWEFRAGYDFLSGDKYFATPNSGMIGLVRHDVVRGFNSLYGSHHKFYGAMDFFYVSTYVGGFTPGLQNLYVGADYSPVKGLKADLSYHYLATATKLEDSEMTLGHELELSLSWNFMKNASLSAGYTFMKGTETMEALKRTGDNHRLHWGWLMLTVRPTFFSTK